MAELYDPGMPGQLDPPLSGHDHVEGPADAALTLVMYGDFQCPYCAAAQSMVRRVRERLEGRLRIAFRHFPLPEVHPEAQGAAEASEAAAAQGAFWKMHDHLYAARGRLSTSDLVQHARDLGLDGDRVEQELRNGVHAERVAADRVSGERSGVTGTPAFFVNGSLHDGSFDAGSLIEALEAGTAGATPR